MECWSDMYVPTIIGIMIVITRFYLIDFYYLGHCNGWTSMQNTILFQINWKIAIGKRYLGGNIWPECYKSGTGGSDNLLPKDEISPAKKGSGGQ